MNNTNPAFNYWTRHLATPEQIEEYNMYMEQEIIMAKLRLGTNFIQEIMDASPIKGL